VYTTPGTFTWYPPSGVTSASFVIVGGGGGGGWCGQAGRGGGLITGNNLCVSGRYLYVSVGRGGYACSRTGTSAGQCSYIFVCGNGGSAAIANHYVCDFSKLLRADTNLEPSFYSFSSNIEMISAIANDISYDDIFSYQAKVYCKKGDLVIILSSSGNSKNIRKVVDYCNKNKIETVGISGFGGGYLSNNSKNFLNISDIKKRVYY
jgi:phosphoheptose isomerase